MNELRTTETVSRDTYLAAINRIDRLETILRQIAVLEDVPQGESETKMRLMAALARSMLT